MPFYRSPCSSPGQSPQHILLRSQQLQRLACFSYAWVRTTKVGLSRCAGEKIRAKLRMRHLHHGRLLMNTSVKFHHGIFRHTSRERRSD
eukprot:2951385-Pleurochrysis_carterae.AAC.1